MLSTKFFWIKNNPGSEKWCFEKYFVSEKFLDPKIFFTNNWLNFKPRSYQAEDCRPKSCSMLLAKECRNIKPQSDRSRN